LTTTFLDLFVGGFLAGALVALMALGLCLIFRTTGVLNLSQGAMAAVGAYVCYAAASVMPMAAAVLLAVCVTAGVGALTGFVISSRLGRVSAATAMVATLAIAVVIDQVLQQAWGNNAVIFPNVIGFDPVRLGSVDASRVGVWGFFGAVGLAAALTLFLGFTKLGLAMRAVVDDHEMVAMLGVPDGAIRLLSWAMASALAGVAGFFIATSTGTLSPDIMDAYLIAALLAAVVGGLGSFVGAVAASFALWIAQSLFAVYAPTFQVAGKSVSLTAFTSTLLFAILIAVLLLAPNGIFGRRQEEKV
jgi:branched-subunit amino acid ABC-type transport system permease component